MQVLNEKRIKGLEFAMFTRGVSLFREGLEKELNKLKLGDGVMIGSDEYKMKSHFASVVFGVNEKIKKSGGNSKFTVKTLAGKKGWVVVKIQ